VPPIFPHAEIKALRSELRWSLPMAALASKSMNATPLQPTKLPGFKVVPKRHLGSCFSASQNAYYVLLGRRGAPDAPRERVLFVHYLDHFLDGCQRQIEELWEKRRVLITHVAVKIGKGLPPAHGDLAELYDRAVTVQQLRQKLHPRFRRL
jgi:hypothetical protein